jgi:hypothetical protein
MMADVRSVGNALRRGLRATREAWDRARRRASREPLWMKGLVPFAVLALPAVLHADFGLFLVLSVTFPLTLTAIWWVVRASRSIEDESRSLSSRGSASSKNC